MWHTAPWVRAGLPKGYVERIRADVNDVDQAIEAQRQRWAELEPPELLRASVEERIAIRHDGAPDPFTVIALDRGPVRVFVEVAGEGTRRWRSRYVWRYEETDAVLDWLLNEGAT